MTVSFEISGPDMDLGERPEVIEVYFDQAGLEEMIRRLTMLGAKSDHFHLMAPSWGDRDDLNEVPQNPKFTCAKHVKVILL